MRIVFLSWRDLAHPQAGGSEVVVDRLAVALQQRGHETALLCGGPVGPRDYPVVSLGGTYLQYARAPLAARRFADWDLLVDTANGIPYFSPMWWRKPRLCLFHHLHGAQWGEYFPAPVAAVGSLLERRVVPLVYRSTHFLAVSPSTKHDLCSIGAVAHRVHLVHNGVDPSVLAEPHPSAAEPTFLVLGRLAANKALDRLFDLWERVRPVTGGRLLVVGDGPERGRLEARAPAGTEFVGRVGEAEKVRLLGEAWLLLHTAPREGWGMVIIEAAAQETPTLAFDVDGVRDAVVDGETGVLVRSDDEFVDAWVALAADRVRRDEMGRKGRARAQRFSWDASADELLAAAERAMATS
jgi:glycosyltransferase involved in cell wall biosynthesis